MVIKLFRFLLPLLLVMAGISAASASSEPVLRVGIEAGMPSVKITFPSGGEQYDEKNRRVKVFRAGETFCWTVPAAPKPEPKKARRIPLRKPAAPSLVGRRMHFQAQRGTLSLNGRAYRGSFDVAFGKSGAAVVNQVGLEDYLRGVVGSEIGSLSPAETLKAQAVIARTWAIANRGKHGKDGYDLCDREHCQVYGGVKAERASVDAAVTATRGVILISDGAPISTMYHAACGGMTSDNEKVYGGAPTRYLRRVRCDYCKGASKYRWTEQIGLDRLRKGLAAEGLSFSTLYAAEILSPAPLDRVEQVRLRTDKGELRVKGTTFRRLFNLPSTTFVLLQQGPVQAAASAVPVASGAGAAGYGSIRLFAGGRISGPPQLVVQTSAGIRRVRRPTAGWIVVSGIPRTLDTSVKRGLPLNQGITARSGITIQGRGYGHQVGLCQAGAIELGKRRWSYRQILAQYYSHVSLRLLRYETVRRQR
ncbi:MAG TPA: SpoIID/LytB domain-containing protein [Candidatus Ozemobacteraceae bacterium]